MNPMQEKMEEWKKNVVQLDKDHAKGTNLNMSLVHTEPSEYGVAINWISGKLNGGKDQRNGSLLCSVNTIKIGPVLQE